MNTLYLIFYIAAAVCFAASFLGSFRETRGTGTANGVNMNLVALGLLFWVLVPLISQARSLS